VVSAGAITTSGGAVSTVTTATNVTIPTIPANWLTAAGTAADFGAELATAIWTDTTAGDFTVAASVGKSVMNGVALGTGLTVAAVSGAVGSVTGAVGSVTGAVGSVTGNVGGSVASVTAAVTLTAAYDLAKTASQAGDAMTLTGGERNSVADAFLGRNVSGGSSSGRLVKESLYVLRNKVDAGAGIVYQTDDTTSSWAFAVSTVPGNPIQVITPI
jgi:hypothetical protein